MISRVSTIIAISLMAPLCWGQSAERLAGPQTPSTIIGPRNVPLHLGAQALLSGDSEEGVRLTHEGLENAVGRREEEAALSNLCAGYIKLGQFQEALKFCDLLLARNDKNWRGYNNRAVAYIMMKQWDKANDDLLRGEALNPNATTMKIARSMYMDAVHPVRPEVEIDDREIPENEDSDE